MNDEKNTIKYKHLNKRYRELEGKNIKRKRQQIIDSKFKKELRDKYPDIYYEIVEIIKKE